MSETKIVMLDRALLKPHPDNPRKNLGDLTELTESIKRSGIMQNLTVVPDTVENGKYRIVIGHRRFAASGMAGIDRLPCVISDMDAMEQLATMMSENMQRNDLTIAEQAAGVQMMLDLGETVDTVSEKTGLSKDSVRKRAKISTLGKKVLNAAEQGGVTITDLLRIADIEDTKEREHIMDLAGNGLEYRGNIRQALRKQDLDKKLERARAQMEEHGIKPVKNEWDGYHTRLCKEYDLDEGDVDFSFMEEGKTYEYSQRFGGPVIVIFQINAQAQKEDEKNKEAKRIYKEKKKQREEWARALNLEMFDLRSEFIRDFRAKSEAHRNTIRERLIDEALEQQSERRKMSSTGPVTEQIRRCLQMPDEEERDPEESFIDEMRRRGVNKDALVIAWAVNGGIFRQEYYYTIPGYIDVYDQTHTENKKLDAVYEFLQWLGYEMTPLEKSLKDGTHEFFKEG